MNTELAESVEKFYTDKEKKRSYARNTKVKHWDNCDCCKTLISKAMAKRNGGFCGVCTEMYQ